MDQLYAQLSKLTKDHKTLEDESSQVHVKISQERNVHTQVCTFVGALMVCSSKAELCPFSYFISVALNMFLKM